MQLLLLIPALVFLSVAALLAWLAYRAFRLGFPGNESQSRTRFQRLAGAATGGCFTLLLVFWFVPPGYISAKYVCNTSASAFSGHYQASGDGLLDLTEELGTETISTLLAKRKIAFFEQIRTPNMAGRHHFDYYQVREFPQKTSAGPYVRLQIAKRGSAGCLLEGGRLTYNLFVQGMGPDECLSFVATTNPTGRFMLKRTTHHEWGATITDYELIDGMNAGNTSTIRSASFGAVSSLGGAIVQSLLPKATEAFCRANLDSIMTVLSPAPDQVSSHLPAPAPAPDIPTDARPILFEPSGVNLTDFRKLELNHASQDDLRVSVDKSKVLFIRSDEFVAHIDFAKWLDVAHSEYVRAFSLKSDAVIIAKQRIFILTPEARSVFAIVPVDRNRETLSLDFPIRAVVENGKLLLVARNRHSSNARDYAVHEANIAVPRSNKAR